MRASGLAVGLSIGLLLGVLAAPNITQAASVTASNVKCSGCVGINSDGSNDLGSHSVTRTRIALGAIDSARIASGAVTSTKLATGSVTNSKLASGAVSISKLSFDPATQTELNEGLVGLGAEFTSSLEELMNSISGRYQGAFCAIAPSYRAGPCHASQKVSVDGSTIDQAGTHVSVAIGVNGNPTIAYRAQTTTDLRLVRCLTLDCSSHSAAATLDGASANVGLDPSLAIGIDGFPIVSYRDATNHDLKLVHCTSEDCSLLDTPIVLDDTASDVGQQSSIGIGVDGNAVVSYRNNSGGGLRVVHCSNPSCSAHEAPEVVDASSVNMGFYSSLAIGSSGFPIISYSDGDGFKLRIVACTTLSCSTHNAPLDLDSNSPTGFYSSIAVGLDGNPVVAEYAFDAGLKLVHCTTSTCSAHDEPVLLDSSPNGGIGLYTSTAIGAHGFPQVSYYDSQNQLLKFVQCVDVTCSSASPPITVGGTGLQVAATAQCVGIDGRTLIAALGPDDDLILARPPMT
jgi:hypothetical protein